MKQVGILVLNNFFKDNRVRKVHDSLCQRGFTVNSFCLADGTVEFERSDIKPLAHYRRYRNPFLKKISQLFSFFKFTILAIHFTKQMDVIWCNDLNTLHIGFVSKAIFRNKIVIYDSHELHTDTIWNYNRRFKKKIIEYWEKILVRKADEVVTVSPSICAILSQRFDLNVSLLPNCLPRIKQVKLSGLEQVHQLKQQLGIDPDDIVCVFHGGMTQSRGIEEILRLAEMSSCNEKFLFIGNGPLDELIMQQSNKCKNIIKLDFVDHEVLLAYLDLCDFGFILYDASCDNHRYCLPNKLFEYSARGVTCVYNQELFDISAISKEYSIVLEIGEFKKSLNYKGELSRHIAKFEEFERFNLDYDWDQFVKQICLLH